MDRREFLTGLFGVAATAVLPTTALALSQPTTEDWIKAVNEIHAKCFSDLVIFGTCYMKYIEEFPYIKHVPLYEVYND